MSIQFAREPLTDALWAEAMPLLVAHKDEIAHYPDIPLEPDIALYAANEQAGVLRCFTARDSKTAIHGSRMPRLVGYALYFVRANPHYKSSVQAVQDVIYLDPSVRGGTGYKFIAWCDAQLASEGVQAVYHHVKAKHDFGRLLERQHYELVDYIYAKRLDAPSSESTIPGRATWKLTGQSVRVVGIIDGLATIITDGYASSNTCPVDELSFGTDSAEPMGAAF